MSNKLTTAFASAAPAIGIVAGLAYACASSLDNYYNPPTQFACQGNAGSAEIKGNGDPGFVSGETSILKKPDGTVAYMQEIRRTDLRQKPEELHADAIAAAKGWCDKGEMPDQDVLYPVMP